MKCSLCAPKEDCQLPLPSASQLLGYESVARPLHYPLNTGPRTTWFVFPLSEKERLERGPVKIREIYESCLRIANSSSGRNCPSKEEIIDTFSYILRISPFAVRSTTGAFLQAPYFKEEAGTCTYRTLLPLTYEDRLAQQEGTYVSLAERALQLYPNDPEITPLAHRIFRERAPQYEGNGALLRDAKGFPLLPHWMAERLASYDPRKDLSLSARRAL